MVSCGSMWFNMVQWFNLIQFDGQEGEKSANQKWVTGLHGENT